ncbi:hypothetical protein GEV33_000309 [Tenebrio molitor]|uniref:Uncharacterized protein n=1 Tax=Tenebrio molitor TaxID=7067 RepID=A0A8J6HXS5_TENMO|nr:hypothetical protein GEV33_000309 [Tenebrio molitor]
MLRHYAGLFEEHGAKTPILKQADCPFVYTFRSDAGNHAEHENTTSRESSTAIESTPGKKEVAPGKPLDTSTKPYVVPTYGFEGEVVALQSCSTPSGYQSSVLVVSPST